MNKRLQSGDSQEVVAEATDEQLKRVLITSDGQGREFKDKVLKELLTRAEGLGIKKALFYASYDFGL